jgi:putative hemolysin
VGENAFSQPLSQWLTQTLHVAEHVAAVTATALVVIIITILTIIFGELVPKRLGQIYPETVARLVAPPME